MHPSFFIKSSLDKICYEIFKEVFYFKAQEIDKLFKKSLFINSQPYILIDSNSKYPDDSFTALSKLIANDTVINLTHNYKFYWDYDGEFKDGITISKDNLVIDGNGFTIDGSNLARVFNVTGNNVTIKNITINNAASAGRPIETRGKIGTINFDNVTINATGGGNTQCLTIGGSQTTSATVNINNSTFNAGSGGYPYISFNPANVTITDSELHGYCAMYFKGVDGSAGSRGSVITARNCNFDAPNIHESASGWNSFGCFVIEDDGINLTINSCVINAVEKNTAEQNAFVMSSKAQRFDNKVVISVIGDSTEIGGISKANNSNWDSKQAYSIEIKGGKYTSDPSKFVNTELFNINQVGSYYTVTAK